MAENLAEKGSLEEQARDTLARLKVGAGPSGISQVVIVFGVVAACLLLLWLSGNGPAHTPESPTVTHTAPSILAIGAGSAANPSILVVESDAVGNGDLFLYTGVPTYTKRNLTSTPGVTETMPALDRTEQIVAYYGIGSSPELYALALSGSPPLPITLAAGTSGLHTDYEIAPIMPPAFSPDGLWVAFPVRSVKQNTVELGIARADGRQVLNVTRIGYELTDFAWIENTSLTILVRDTNGKISKWLAHIENSSIHTDPFP